MKKIILIGAGGHCTSCIDVIENEKKFDIIGLLDKNKTGSINGYKILGDDNYLENKINKNIYVLITIGYIKNYRLREKIYQKIKSLRLKLATIISPMAYISKNSSIGEGSILMHGAIVNAGAKIGKNCIINSKSLIEHDVTIEDNCHISTGAIINGGTVVKKNTFIGSNTAVSNNIIIRPKSTITANTFVKKTKKKILN